MARYDLTEFEWRTIQPLLPNKPRGVPRVDDRRILNGIFWVLRSGSPWADVPERYGPPTTIYNRFNRWAGKGLWAEFFLSYEVKLIRSGCSPTEVMYALTSMQAELGMVKSAPLENPEEALPPRSTWLPTRMEIRLILRSLGVKSTMPKLRQN